MGASTQKENRYYRHNRPLALDSAEKNKFLLCNCELMCSRWEQRLFTKEVADALLIAKDAVECPEAELTPISKHFNLGGLDYAMCFITRHKGSHQQEELNRHCFGSTSARLENCPRMNSHDISVLTHFGLPCSFLLYACTDRSLGCPLKTSIPQRYGKGNKAHRVTSSIA